MVLKWKVTKSPLLEIFKTSDRDGSGMLELATVQQVGIKGCLYTYTRVGEMF